MKTQFQTKLRCALLFAWLVVLGWVQAQDPVPSGAGWRYTLLEGSYLLDDCLICGRPSILQPMRGTFTLRLVSENPLFSTYALEDIDFMAAGDYRVTGSGEYQIGGEVALLQSLRLDVKIATANEVIDAKLETPFERPGRRWPMLLAAPQQTNGTLVQTFTLTLATGPLRELWFSTANGFTSGTKPDEFRHISDGDLLSSAGRVVKTQQELRLAWGVSPEAPDQGLDAVDVVPGGRILFSASQSSAKLPDGHLISDRGELFRSVEEMLGKFVLMPPVPPVGLDAAQLVAPGEVWFSIRENVFSEGLGRPLTPGALLSEKGEIVRENGALLTNFRPMEPKLEDYGLDALHVWPDGEIWFSVDTGFQDEVLGTIQRGDILSDAGYVVFRNLELLQPFSPLEDLADFGLDALFVVSDAIPSSAPPVITGIQRAAASGQLIVDWKGVGLVFQVERAANPAGPYLPVSPIVSGQSVQVPATDGFFRVRQW